MIYLNLKIIFYIILYIMSKIIALRESLSGGNDNSNPIQQRGEFTTNIDPYLVLNKGDSIGIKQVFLDTRSTTQGKIKIDATNQNVSLKHFLYITDRKATPPQFHFKDLNGSGIVHPDGQRYIFSKKSGGQTNNLGFITEIQIPRKDIKQPRGPNPASNPNFLNGFDVTFSFQAPDPQDHTKFITSHATVGIGSGVYTDDLVTFKYGNQKGAPTTFKIPMFDNGTKTAGCNIVFDDTKALEKDGITDVSTFQITTQTSVASTTIEPLPFIYNFKLDEGDYSPDDLARTITDKLIISKTIPTGGNTGTFTFTNDQNDVDTKFMFNNPYFTSIGQVTDPTEKVNWGNDEEDLPFFVREDGKSILQIDKTANTSYFFGCSEMSLQFNDETQKFVFTQLHQPIFSAGGGGAAGAVEVINSVVTVGTKKLLIGESGGVLFTDLATDQRPFIQDILGFDSSLFVQKQQGQVNASFTDAVGGGVENGVTTYSVDLEMAVNATSGITGCDSAVVKGANFDTEQVVTESAILNNFEIFAQNSVSQSHLSDGYFIIEIDGLPNTDVRGYNTGSIQAIVSRYYATADFVIMEGYSGSIPYVHESDEPFILSSLNIRILNADRSTIGQLGTNNTIFLEYTPSA